MSDIVSARRLRKSVLKDLEGAKFNINNDVGLDINKNIGKMRMDTNINAFSSSNLLENDEKNNFHINFKTKLLIKCFFAIVIVFCSLVCKLVFKNEALSNKYISKIVIEYKKDYSKEYILEKIESLSQKGYNNAKYIIPENLANKVKSKYVSSVKPRILDFNLKEEVKSVINNNISSNQLENVVDNNMENISNETEEVLDGKGGGEPLAAEGSVLEEISAVSMMQDDIGVIVSKNINMIKPLSGTITSKYGARDKIFEGVNSYHTGIDIAAKSGTEIKSVTSGKVIKVIENDKYYGNYVIVEVDSVRFKYAHMKEIKVKLNDNLKQNDLIGLVGSTGMSTGPHLHLEISINSRTVDPQSLIQF